MEDHADRTFVRQAITSLSVQYGIDQFADTDMLDTQRSDSKHERTRSIAGCYQQRQICQIYQQRQVPTGLLR